jgi:hypothetical protein
MLDSGFINYLAIKSEIENPKSEIKLRRRPVAAMQVMAHLVMM